jgi:hypothetical protein
LIGRAGVTSRTEAGWLNAELYLRPVRESMLSYVGTRDPYGGTVWGRVRETGVSLGGFVNLPKQWGLYARLGYGTLEGRTVDDNDVVRANLAVGKNLGLAGFDYFSVGPYLDYARYSENLSHFTLGHGGYFSPQRLYAVGLGVDALTREGRNYIAALQAQLAYQAHHEDAAPLFPLAPDGRAYDASDSSGIAARVSAKGVLRLTGHWQLGGGLEYQKTPNYREAAAMVFVRWNVHARPAVFSSDLPDAMFNAAR